MFVIPLNKTSSQPILYMGNIMDDTIENQSLTITLSDEAEIAIEWWESKNGKDSSNTIEKMIGILNQLFCVKEDSEITEDENVEATFLFSYNGKNYNRVDYV